MSKLPSDDLIYRKRNKSEGIKETGEAWAVSYSDLLMVMMSFFIVFLIWTLKSPVV